MHISPIVVLMLTCGSLAAASGLSSTCQQDDATNAPSMLARHVEIREHVGVPTKHMPEPYDYVGPPPDDGVPPPPQDFGDEPIDPIHFAPEVLDGPVEMPEPHLSPLAVLNDTTPTDSDYSICFDKDNFKVPCEHPPQPAPAQIENARSLLVQRLTDWAASRQNRSATVCAAFVPHDQDDIAVFEAETGWSRDH